MPPKYPIRLERLRLVNSILVKSEDLMFVANELLDIYRVDDNEFTVRRVPKNNHDGSPLVKDGDQGTRAEHIPAANVRQWRVATEEEIAHWDRDRKPAKERAGLDERRRVVDSKDPQTAA